MATLASRDMTAATQGQLGGKAKTLCQLQAAGFNVPAFVVSPEDIGATLKQLGSPVAVRSSASLEDSEHASFAGQFQSFLNLRTPEEVQQAIAACHESVDSDTVREYCRRAGCSIDEIQMHVIVQRMIQPELAGVAFSVNPVTGQEEVVIEACPGLSDELLAGHTASMPADHERLLKYRPKIEALVRAIQSHFGTPQDIEFAVQDEIIYVLQSRPITRIGFAGVRGEWTNADFRDGGVSAGVCSPLMASLYQKVWDHALKTTLRELHLFNQDFQASRVFFARPYWNVGEVKRCVAQLPGYCEADFDRDLSIPAAYDGDGLRTPLTLGRVLKAIPTVLATRRFINRQESRARQCLDGRQERWIRQYRLDSKRCSQAFQAIVEGPYLQLESEYFRTIYAVSLAKMELLGSFPDADDRALVSGLPPLAHMAPVVEVRRLRDRSTASLRAILRKYRHHSRLGLDIYFPRWDEDEKFVLQMLRDVPKSSTEKTNERYEQARDEMTRGLSRWQRRRFENKLQRLRRLVWLREEMRDLSNRMYHLLRQLALGFGREERMGDDVFMMGYDQLVSNDRSRITHQRQQYQGYRHYRPPNEIGDRYHDIHHTNTGNALRGLGASGGMAQGRAFVAHTVAQVAQMPLGSVLVCPFTDPGWTPVLARASAVVTETGGLLSHAAVICREYGIPAVLGVKNATHRIRTGDEVMVCGSEGRVDVS